MKRLEARNSLASKLSSPDSASRSLPELRDPMPFRHKATAIPDEVFDLASADPRQRPAFKPSNP